MIQYDCDCPDLAQQLKDFYNRYVPNNRLPMFPTSSKIVVAPYPGIENGHRIALTVLGKDFERLEPGLQMKTFANPMRGAGPFLHNDPEDRPPAAFAGRTTIHTGGARASYLLLPVIPA